MFDQDKSQKPKRVITVRLSGELHDQLKHAAWQRKVSLNKLCVDGLQQLAGQHEQETAAAT